MAFNLKVLSVLFFVATLMQLSRACEPPDCDRPDCGTCGKPIWISSRNNKLQVLNLIILANACCNLLFFLSKTICRN
jgi:hypothetical protein